MCTIYSQVHSSELRDTCMSAYTSQINGKCHFWGDAVCNSEDCMVLKRFTVKTNKTRLIFFYYLRGSAGHLSREESRRTGQTG